jgi:acetyl-CoA C-acetyltransferase
MSIRGEAYIGGVFEHPLRKAPDKSTGQLHAEVINGALADADLDHKDVDGLATLWPGTKPTVMSAEYLGFNHGQLSFLDSTGIGGASYIAHAGHAAAAIAQGKAEVVVISLAGRPRSAARDTGTAATDVKSDPPSSFEEVYGPTIAGQYALAASRHMHEYGTTSEQLAEIRVDASHHAQFNDNAMYQDPVTVEDVVNSRIICDPLHLLDCCVISDGGGAIVLVSPDIAESLDRETPVVLGHGESPKHHAGGKIDLTYTGAVWSGPRAFNEAQVTPNDIDIACIYDSYTITVLETLEDLGFCKKGDGGKFVEGGTLQAPDGELPFNTDGGGLCNNHPNNQGGMTKMIETVRQLRGEANSEVQVPDCEIGLAHGTGGRIGTRMGSATIILGEEGYA